MDERIFLAKLNKKIKTYDYIKYLLSAYYSYNFYDIVILKKENKKPYIKDNRIYFSVSHKNDYIIAIFSNEEIGIDMEILNNKDYSKILNRYFFDDEKKYVNNAKSDKDYNLRFFEIWTKKEAYIKRNALNISYIKKINSLKKNIHTFIIQDFIISVCK